MKNNSKYLTEYLDEVTKPIVLMFPQMGGYVKTLRNNNGKQNMIEDWQNIELKASPVYGGRFKSIILGIQLHNKKNNK